MIERVLFDKPTHSTGAFSDAGVCLSRIGLLLRAACLVSAGPRRCIPVRAWAGTSLPTIRCYRPIPIAP